MAAPLSDATLPVAPGLPTAVTTAATGRRRAWTAELGLYIPAAVIILLLFFCFVWPLVYPVPKPVGGSILNSNLPIGSRGHILGTDTVGDDIMSRLLYGGRVSFEVGGATQLIGLAIGGFFGIIAGYRGGVVDAIIMRLLDVLIAFPSLVLVLAIADGLGPSKVHVIWALAILAIPFFARLARAATLRLREQPFMMAASLSGTKLRRTLLRHVVPNILPQLVTFTLLGAGVAIILEGALDFLGYGVPAPGPSWGNMIADGQSVLSAQPRFVLLPSLALLITVVSLNMLGDALRARWATL